MLEFSRKLGRREYSFEDEHWNKTRYQEIWFPKRGKEFLYINSDDIYDMIV